MDPTLSAADKLLYLNYELFLMIETSVDMELLTLLYSSQLTTRDQRALLDDQLILFHLHPGNHRSRTELWGVYF